MDTDLTTHTAPFAELGVGTLYALLRLRTDVFVVEQEDPYPELDGRDTEPGTLHLWLARHERPVAYLRLLDEADGSARVGRVVVAADERGHGLAGALMDEALRLVGDRRCVLGAQAHLAGFYARYGFVRSGPDYLDGRIPHVPMVRD